MEEFLSSLYTYYLHFSCNIIYNVSHEKIKRKGRETSTMATKEYSIKLVYELITKNLNFKTSRYINGLTFKTVIMTSIQAEKFTDLQQLVIDQMEQFQTGTLEQPPPD